MSFANFPTAIDQVDTLRWETYEPQALAAKHAPAAGRLLPRWWCLGHNERAFSCAAAQHG